MRRAAHAEWPRLLLPDLGCFPLAVQPRRDERVLHIALRNGVERQPALHAALRGIATEYAEAEHDQTPATTRDLPARALEAAASVRPTLIFMQLQGAGILEPHAVERLRCISDPSCVIVNWDGDQHHGPMDPERRWFVDLGRVCDVSAVVNTAHPHDYARLGVKHPAYLQIGIDGDLYRPTEPADGVAPVVMLAGHYGTVPAYARRLSIANAIMRDYPGRFCGYGYGWEEHGGGAFLKQHEEAPVYAAARAALNMSICNDLPRYSSDRLFRALASWAVVLVEQIPDCEGLGLAHGENCLIWRDWSDLKPILDQVLQPGGYPDANAIRFAAAALGREHTWSARMPELQALVDAVRTERGPA